MKKQMLKKGARCNVTFNLSKEAVGEAKKVSLVGDFNDWDIKNPLAMKRQKNGSFQVRVTLKAGQDYHFRYLIDNEKWENDWSADRYESSPLYANVENSVVCLSQD